MTTKTNLQNTYLSIKIGCEQFAIKTNNIVAILNSDLTNSTLSFGYDDSKVQLYNYNLPIIDLKEKLYLLPSEPDRIKKIVVIKLHSINGYNEIGLAIDSFDDIITIDSSKIQPVPTHGSLYENEYIAGISKNNNKYFLILDIDKTVNYNHLLYYNKSYSEINYQYLN